MAIYINRLNGGNITIGSSGGLLATLTLGTSMRVTLIGEQ